MWENWVVDVSFYSPEFRDLLCFVPIEGDINLPDCSFIIGMNLLTSPEKFDKGKVVAIVHKQGQEAVDRWCRDYPDLLKRLKDRKG